MGHRYSESELNLQNYDPSNGRAIADGIPLEYALTHPNSSLANAMRRQVGNYQTVISNLQFKVERSAIEVAKARAEAIRALQESGKVDPDLHITQKDSSLLLVSGSRSYHWNVSDENPKSTTEVHLPDPFIQRIKSFCSRIIRNM